MKRAFLALVMLLPSVAVAQEIETPFLVSARAAAELEASKSFVVRDRAQVAQATAAQQPVAVLPEARRRRPSMVGYIDDASIGSQVRLRYDLGIGNETPDLAEFFYAKCGCFRRGDANNENLDPNAAGPFEAGVVTDLDFQQTFVQGEVALRSRLSLFADLPFRSIDPKANKGGGPRRLSRCVRLERYSIRRQVRGCFTRPRCCHPPGAHVGADG